MNKTGPNVDLEASAIAMGGAVRQSTYSWLTVYAWCCQMTDWRRRTG